MTKKVIELVIPEDSDFSKIGYPDEKSIQQTIDLGFNAGLIKKKIDIKDSVDATYWEEAAK